MVSMLRPDSRFALLGPEFGDLVEPAEFPEALLRWRNDRAAADLGLEGLSDGDWMARFARFEPLDPSFGPPVAMRYHGHQFRTYNADIGDGRGFLYAQLRDRRDRLIDLASKGSGRTPWSRDGDGRLTLKGAVREALASEMLEALGVPTGRTLSIVETGEQLARFDEPSPTRGAVLVRALHSHVRIGTFQRHAFFDRRDLLAQLVDHVVDAYFPDLGPTGDAARVSALLGEVTRRQASLAARWMAAGFVHGVLNTDNLNVTGESFDYGPWRFLPHYDPAFTAAYFDEGGLYAYGRQPEAVFWNLQQLAACLALLVEDHAPLIEALNGFSAAYHAALREAFTARLGIRSRGEEADGALVVALLTFLRDAGETVRFEPVFFDWFGGLVSEARARRGARAGAYSGSAFAAFHTALGPYEPAGALGHGYFGAADPQEMLYPEVEAIWAPIADKDDWSLFHAKIRDVRDAGEAYALAPFD
ncbi:MAG: YdiU family protein [Caulobacteraceae bacterium]|nr:YdiU family protein [Caulobacteraceae bacterium]